LLTTALQLATDHRTRGDNRGAETKQRT
jgi:hypothetical protein